MGIKDLDILVDNPSNTWNPGQVINGRIYVSADKTENVRGVKLFFKGEADVSWESSSNISTSGNISINTSSISQQPSQKVYSHEDYFNTNYFLLGSESSGAVEIPFGDNYYPFSCPLPPNLPSSFEGKYGSVTYTLKAVVDRPWKVDKSKTLTISVLDTFDLNQEPRASEKVQQESSKTFCCLCCGSKPLNIIISLPFKGYVPGQAIPIRITYDNMSGIMVKSMKIQLQEVVTYHAHTPQVENKEESTTLAEDCTFPSAGETSGDFLTQLTIPSLSKGNLQKCRIIDLDYYIQIEARMPKWYKSAVQRALIYIGNIPLVDQLSPYQTNYSSIFQTKENAFEFTAPSVED